MLGGVGLIFCLPVDARAQSPSTANRATIAVQEVEVRSGPSANFYATSKLHRGDSVRIVREENGWFAIEPPSPESFSWINASYVEQSGQTATVKTAEAPVRVGSRLVDKPPDVERHRVKQGTQLMVIGKAETTSDGAWLPILPAPSEVRYIPMDAIKATPAVQQTVSTPAPAVTTPSSFSAAGTMAAQTGAAPGRNPLLTEAEQAERQGNFREAERLYEQLARQVSLTDHDLAMRCLNRSQYLRDAERAGTARQATSPEGRLAPAVTAPYGQPAGAYGTNPTAQLTSQYCYAQESAAPVRLTPPAGAVSNSSQAVAPAAAQPQWFGPGRLYRPGFSVDGKPTYGFESSNGQWRMYVTAPAGTDLESQVGHNAYLYGPVTYRGELRTYHLTATQVNPLP
jgi:hypothetical protein